MLVSQQWTEASETCGYLHDRPSLTQYGLIAEIEPAEYEERMNAGWRKFGPCLLRPICESCTACRPIRIRLDDFEPDRSQRRALKRNADLRICLGQPTVDETRLALWKKYHDAQAGLKGWASHEMSADDYVWKFVLNPMPVTEIAIYEEETLRAIVIADVTPNVVSGVYHYHDPDCRDRSLGTFALMETIALAQRLGKRYAYFGYYVAGCSSMEYKSRFRPSEIMDPEGTWQEIQG